MQKRLEKKLSGRFVSRLSLDVTLDTLVNEKARLDRCDADVLSVGLAISPDNVHMVVSHSNDTLSVYLLPSCVFVACIGREGPGNGQFYGPAKMCFTCAGNLLVVDSENERVQELMLTGDHVRNYGEGMLGGKVWGIATNDLLIAVAKWSNECNNRIVLIDAVTGMLVRAFGDYGDAPGQLMSSCNGLRFTPDSRHLVGAESDGEKGRLSMFTITGEFVACIGDCVLHVPSDVEFGESGEILVSDFKTQSVCVFAPDGGAMLRVWSGDKPVADGAFTHPTALALCKGQLYVLNETDGYVQVFE